MATGGHAFTGVTGKITTGGSIEGYVEADFKLEYDMDKYIEQGSNVAIDHTFGMKKVTGKITKAWGITTGQLYDWFNNKEEKLIVFDPGDGNNTYTCSGCSLKSLGSSIKAGDKGALMLNADFEGLNWSSTDNSS
ncbi:hypothetical protein [Sulfuricurvum sp.]|uniref:hypothetical protein n=1 Tax=Sulfuricurvum sp. TaxID=2025608 RepID=UPI003562C910